MKSEKLNFSGMFSPKIMARAIQTFDRATAVVVGICWAAALAVLSVAVLAVNISVKAKREVATAAAAEPSLPKMVSKPPESTEIKPLVEKVGKIFPDIKVVMATDRSVNVSATDGGKFRLWLTALGYIDTISPQYRWTMKNFCVGFRCGGSPMTAVLVAEKITFANPDSDK